eukprot:7760196-Ditylum_brightwellii.AAC.1
MDVNELAETLNNPKITQQVNNQNKHHEEEDQDKEEDQDEEEDHDEEKQDEQNSEHQTNTDDNVYKFKNEEEEILFGDYEEDAGANKDPSDEEYPNNTTTTQTPSQGL